MIQQRLAEKELKREAGTTGLQFITAGYKKEVAKNLAFQEDDDRQEAYNKKHGALNSENAGSLMKGIFKQNLRPDLNFERYK